MDQQTGRLLRQAQQMEEALAGAQEQLAEVFVVGESPDGLVRVRVSAAGEVKSVRVKPEALDVEDVKELEKAVKAAVGDALGAARQAAAQRTAEAVGALNA